MVESRRPPQSVSQAIMKRSFEGSNLASFLCGTLLSLVSLTMQGQGTVNFSNVGVDAPFTSNGDAEAAFNGELLGNGYFAELQLADGTAIGERTEFLTRGLFSGGARVVPQRQGGSTVQIKIAVQNAAGDDLLISNIFEVRLGQAGVPPTPPTKLFGLTAWNIPRSTSTSSLSSVSIIKFQRTEDGRLRITWPKGTTLLGAATVRDFSTTVPIVPMATVDGLNLVVVSPLKSQQFFWVKEE